MRLISISLLILAGLISCKNNTPISSSQLQHKDISVAQASDLLQKGQVNFLDVRTPGEIADGKIKGAIELDFRDDNFKAELNKLDKDVPYVVYCRSGGRSAKAAKLMSEAGFKDVSNMLGGYSNWK